MIEFRASNMIEFRA